MGTWILGTAGFFLYFIYDLNSVLWKNDKLCKLFALGSLFVVSSAVWEMAVSGSPAKVHPLVKTVCAAGAIIFLILLIYTLFFALPFEETYLEENRMRPAYTKGVYSLCRHPGVLWFAGVYLCLWGFEGRLHQGIYFISMIMWNYLYIVFQDIWTFPRTFTNYSEYKKNTPFLLPNKKSIKACLSYCIAGIRIKAEGGDI